MRTRAVWFTILIANWLLQTPVKAGDTLALKGPNSIWIDQYYTCFEDVTRKLPVASVYSAYLKGKFKPKYPPKPHPFNKGFTQSNWWLHLYVKNDTTFQLPLLWSFYNNDIEFQLYEVKDGRPVFINAASSHIHPTDRPFYARSVSFRFEVPPGATKELMIKTTPLNSENLYFPTDITTPEDYYQWELDLGFEIGRYIGFFFLAVAINLLLFITLRYILHLYFATYILFMIGFQLREFLLDGLWLSPGIYPVWSLIPKTFFLIGICYLALQIFVKFLRLEKRSFWPARFWGYIKIAYSLFIISFLGIAILANQEAAIQQIMRISATIVAALTMLFILGFSVYALFKKYKDSLLYICSNIFLIVSILEYILNSAGIIHLFLIYPGNIILSATLEVGLFSVVLVYQYSRNKQQTDATILQLEKDKMDLYADILQVQENERRRIAQDLHDDVGGIASSLKLLLSNYFIKPNEAKGNVLEEKKLLDQAALLTERIREVSHDLLPKDFEERGLTNVLEQKVEVLNETTAIRFDLLIEGKEHLLSKLYQVIVYRIISELLTNIIKHSKASIARIQINFGEEVLELMIEDDGIGIEENQRGIGMQSLQSRIQFLKGTIHTDSSKMGTTFIIQIPYH